MAMRFVEALQGLKTHPALCDLTFESISRYARLVGHLKRDILRPQPLDQSDFDTAPKILPPSIHRLVLAQGARDFIGGCPRELG
jgi:hypothetical protein